MDQTNPFGVPHMVLFQGEIITLIDGKISAFSDSTDSSFSFNGTVLGTESFTFDLLAGLAPATATDFSGNTTTFHYDDTWDFLTNYPFLSGANYAFGKYADVTSQVDAKNQTKSFVYYPVVTGSPDPRDRRLTQMTDEAGRTTKYTLDAHGNRADEKVYDPFGLLVKWTQLEYGNPQFPGFVTWRTVHALNNQ